LPSPSPTSSHAPHRPPRHPEHLPARLARQAGLLPHPPRRGPLDHHEGRGGNRLQPPPPRPDLHRDLRPRPHLLLAPRLHPRHARPTETTTMSTDRPGDMTLTAEQRAHQPEATQYAINTDGVVSSRAGTLGPADAHESLCEAVQKPGQHRVRFRMYDDDGIYYYGGFLTYDPELTEHLEPSWQPVQDFGMPDAGC